MEYIKGLYPYKENDRSFFIVFKMKQTLGILAKKENRPFDDVYADFLESSTYRAMQDTRSLMWYENAEFIADEYYRETRPGG